MFKRLAIAAAARLRAWWWIAALASTVLLSTVLAAGAATDAEDATVLLIERAYAQQSVGAPVSFTQPARVVMLPDDWSSSWPRFQGIVLYSVGFDRPPVADRQALLALYIERACSTLDVYLNGQRVFSGGRLAEPVTRNCQYPQLISLPSALLRDSGNRLDLQVRGQALERVASSRRAGGLSALKIGPQAALESEYEARLFWNVTSVQIASVALTVMGAILVGLGWMHRREAHLGYLGLLSLSWVVLSMRVWWQNGPWDTGV
ncbi:MAG: sensor histidine kinase, partial [Burkholderiaceae bacterium]